jgi:hypothetical protein
MRRSSRALAGAALALAALTPASPALAFCRTSSCTSPDGGQATGSKCTPTLASDCGVPLFWPTLCVGYSLQKDASPKEGITLDAAQALFQQAFAAWTSAPCDGGGTPRIAVEEVEPAECSAHEYNQKAGNANIITFRDDKWPYAGSSNTLALTTVTYNLDNGEIYDADMELNSADLHFTTGDGKVEFDLLSVITHEAGHFLGLAHSAEMAATMFPSYNPGDTSLRNLDADDRAGICAIYPPGADIPESCDTTPRHGFSILCADQQGPSDGTEFGGCCAVAPGAALPGGPWASAAAALGAVLLLCRRRDRATPRR